MVADSRAVFAARVAEVLFAFLLEAIFKVLACLAVGVDFSLAGRDILAFLVVDVSSHFEIEVCSAGGGDTISPSVWLACCD